MFLLVSSVCILVDRKGIEPFLEACKATVLPLSLTAHCLYLLILAGVPGIEPGSAELEAVILPLYYTPVWVRLLAQLYP